MKKLPSLLLVLLLAACGTLPVKYEAQNYYRIPEGTKKQLSVGKFIYEPAEKGGLAANQVHNTALGRIYVSANLADFVKRATALELEKSGFDLSDSSTTKIEGDVIDFTTDDLGFSVDWKYKIKYRILDTAENKTIFEKVYDADPTTTGKFGLAQDFSPSANELILSAYDKFVRDPQVKAALLGE